MPIPKQVEEAGKVADELALNTQGKTSDKSKAAPEGSDEVQGEVIDLETKKVIEKPEDTVESLKHKLSVLQGKYDKEVKPLKDDIGMIQRLKSDVRKLTQAHDESLKRNNDLVKLIADLQKQITEPPKKVEEPVENVQDFLPTELLSKEDVQALDDEGLGSNVMGIISKLVTAVAQRSMPKVEQKTDDELKSRVESLEKRTEEDATQSYWNRVFRGVSGESDLDKAQTAFTALNEGAGLNDWLDVTDPFTGQTRRDLLNTAGKRMDAVRVIEIFNQYQRSVKKAPAAKEKKGIESELEITSSNITRDISGDSGNVEALANKWTPKAIADFYTDASKGRYTAEQQKAKETEIWKVHQNNLKTT